MNLKKIKLPAFLKTKKFLIFLALFLVFFLFTPISLMQVSKGIENYIDEKAKDGVEAFQRQTGLLIDWEKLDFKLLSLTVHLEGVTIKSLSNSQKIEELNFLHGSQKIKKISARPSVFSLFFDKKIFLSKLNIQQGNISLKTIKNYSSSYKGETESFQLPIKKIIIKETQVSVKHKNHVLKLSQIKTTLVQKENRRFNFEIFIESFFIDKMQKHISQHFFCRH